jgi:hypothetical protein
MAVVSSVLIRTRPVRRRLTPGRFKETYINRALAGRSHPTTYCEIGVRDGESLRLVRADRKVGVDPEPTPSFGPVRAAEQLFRTTSDEFFADQALDALRPEGVDVALIDGLHEFEQALRDLVNMIPYMRDDGFIFLDDVNPQNETRASATPVPGSWNGDVWKVAAFVHAERPDLRLVTLDVDQGLGVVTGFGRSDGPANAAAIMPAPDLVERYKAKEYAQLASARSQLLNLMPARRFDLAKP